MAQTTLERRPYTNSELFSGYYLNERLRDRDEWDCDEEAREAYDEIKRVYDGEKDYFDGYKEDQLCEHFVDPVLDALGYNRLSETKLPQGREEIDRLLFSSADDRRDASILQKNNEHEAMYKRGVGLLEAKQWDFDFSKSFTRRRNYANASSQIRYYLEKTPVEWGVLTDGRKWRLYATRSYRTDIYYEVDLPELLEEGDLEAFKYFYLFFRPEAFVEHAGGSFLDDVESESETAAKELGEDLQDNVFTALRVLGRGFVETNDLSIDPDDEEALDELKEQSLVLLYRLMFVLYAESRNLIHPDGEAAVKEYEENFSLDELRFEIHDEIGGAGEGFDDAYSDRSTTMWRKLEDLFALIDEGEEDLGIPPYNGGLFDHDEHEFLTQNAVSNRYVAEVVYRMSTTLNDEGRYVLADYADLDTRHLGSVYEGLLEHQFEIAPEEYAAVAEDGGQVWKPATEVSVAEAVETVPEGGLYVVNDEGERKATGAYYTPDYVVTYIVEETVGPLVDEIRDDLREQGFEPGTQEYIGAFLRRVKSLKVLDPAMGSAHFLTSATGYLAEEVMSEVRDVEEEVGADWDENLVRREIAKECIYGVDVNGMAVELGKLSMWLETLAADRPLAFLDHHLKQGNSLVGSDITDVLSNGADDAEEGQLTLRQSFAQVRERTLDHVMDLMRELLEIDNETLDDIKSMEEKYAEIRSDPLYQRLFELANVHTAEEFGVDVPDDTYERMAEAIEDSEDWAEVRGEDWFERAQEKAREESFFHWELEFPAVFFNVDGDKRDDAGFDAVVGNPPYVKIQNLDPEFAEYSTKVYETSSGRFDIYALFVEKGVELTADGRLSYILPNKFFESGAGDSLREFLVDDSLLSEIIDFGQHQVFEDVTTYTCLLSLHSEGGTFQYGEPEEASNKAVEEVETVEIEIDELSEDKWALTGPREKRALDKIQSGGTSIGELSEHISEGIVSGDNEVMFVEIVSESDSTTEIECPLDGERYEVESEMVKPLVRGDYIERYGNLDTDEGVIYAYEVVDDSTQPISESKLSEEYPRTYDYLTSYEERLRDRGSESMEYPVWYALWCPREKQIFESAKLVVPDVCQRSEFTMDDNGGIYLPNSAYGLVPEDNTGLHRDYILAVLNSAPTWFFIYYTSTILRGDFRRFMTSYLSPLPIPNAEPQEEERETKPDYQTVVENPDENMSVGRHLADAARVALNLHENRADLNLSLLDHLGISPDDELDGPTLADVGLTQPPAGVGDAPVSKTADELDSLRVGRVEVERESPTSVEIRLTARYKPEDKDADSDETDRWGYTETDAYPTLRIADLDEEEADLIEAFVPVAADEAGGFAGFRETATKTNSLVDRLRRLTLPDADAVSDGLESYRRTKERADELDEKIEKTDALIDEIVYDLYGLTDEEIEIVEEAVSD